MMVKNDNMFSYSFIKEGMTTKRVWMKELLQSAWKACTTNETNDEVKCAVY